MKVQGAVSSPASLCMSALPSGDLTGKVALVTGASTGIGRATAVELARRGARVAVDYPDASERENAETTLAQMRDAAPSAESVGLLVEADVSDEHAVEALVEETAETFGGLDILVNNAGIQHREKSAHASDIDLFDKVLAVNLHGAYLCARSALQHFVEQKSGVIVNVSSVHERIPRPEYLSYAVSKFGMQGLTQTLALEYADRGIRVNAIAPGATATPINAAWKDDAEKRAVVASHIPMKRAAEPEEIARVIAWLAGDEAAYMTGQTLFVDGGLVLYADFEKPWSA